MSSTRGVPRLSDNTTRFRVEQVPPLTKRGLPTYLVRDHLHHEVVGAAGSMREAAAICHLLSHPADLVVGRDLDGREAQLELRWLA